MIYLFVKNFFVNFVKTQVYYLSYQLVHIKVLHAKGYDPPEHLRGQTLDPVEKTLDFSSTPCTAVERG